MLHLIGDTALHTMVRQDRLDCALALITHGAQIDAKDNEVQEHPYIVCPQMISLLPHIFCSATHFALHINRLINCGHTIKCLRNVTFKIIIAHCVLLS